jgi:hypothetical protein
MLLSATGPDLLPAEAALRDEAEEGTAPLLQSSKANIGGGGIANNVSPPIFRPGLSIRVNYCW